MYRPLYSCYKNFSDRHERHLLNTIIRPGMTVVDVGANIGVYAEYFSHRVGKQGRVYAFEPSPQNFNILIKGKFNNVTCVNAALGDTTGEITLFISDELNVDHRTYDTGENRKTISIPSYRLDDYITGQRIDFIKMDIQGFEYNALQGMKTILKNNPDIKLLLEFWPYGLKKAGSGPEEVVVFLQGLGFQTWLLEGKELKPCPPVPEEDGFRYYRNLFAARR